MKVFTLLAVVAAFVACESAVRPVPVNIGDTCFRCRRSIADIRYAAEIIDEGMHAYKFRTPKCLAQYLTENPQEPRGMFVTDYDTKRLIRAERALFVPTVINERTNERDFAAFRSQQAARDFARRTGATPLEWEEILGGATAAD